MADDSAYGDQDGFRAELAEAGLPFVMALKPRRGTWAYGDDAHTPVDAACELHWGGPEDPGDWHPVTRTFRDGHAETWWAADGRLGWWGPDDPRRLVVATADPSTLPGKATRYLVTHLPGPAARARPAARTPTARSASAGTPGSPIRAPLTLIGLVTYLGDSITNHSSIRHSASPTFALMVGLIN